MRARVLHVRCDFTVLAEPGRDQMNVFLKYLAVVLALGAIVQAVRVSASDAPVEPVLLLGIGSVIANLFVRRTAREQSKR